MPHSTPAPDPLDTVRRRALYRAWHRGTRELDLLLGAYADKHVAGFDAATLARFEALMEHEEVQLSRWLISGTPPPENRDRQLVEDIRDFHFKRSGTNQP